MLLQKNVWIPILILVLVAIGFGLFYGQHIAKQSVPDQEPIKIYKAVEVETPAAAPKPPPPGETHETGHWHGDEWHSQPHETHETPAVSAGQSYIPEGAVVSPNFPPVDPNADPVEEAYKRLEYIKNNPYAWGGVHSERATELIAELMPAQPARDENHGEEIYSLIVELVEQNDPRAGEVLIATLCEGGVIGDMFFEGLDAVGPPAVPYILPYLENSVIEGGYIPLAIFESIGRIGVRYRADLGGIVDHIIIPKLEVIAADEDAEYYDTPSQRRANETISMLGQ